MAKKRHIQKYNSVQLNLVTFVDVHRAATAKTLHGSIYMMDNSPESIGQGTPELQTVCKQGQVLNWIIYSLDADRRPDGTWPPFAKINNIVFLDEQGYNVSSIRICENLKVYGGPDKIRSPYVPVYYYWAGTVPLTLMAGVYRYRLVIELEGKKAGDAPIYLDIDTPSLRVVELPGIKTN